VLVLHRALVAALRASAGTPFTAEALAAQAGQPEQAELAFKVLEHLAANPGAGVEKTAQTRWWESTYTWPA
jgi:glucose-6-phosphate isomerase